MARLASAFAAACRLEFAVGALPGPQVMGVVEVLEVKVVLEVVEVNP
jgi:hypothetical protein